MMELANNRTVASAMGSSANVPYVTIKLIAPMIARKATARGFLVLKRCMSFLMRMYASKGKKKIALR